MKKNTNDITATLGKPKKRKTWKFWTIFWFLLIGTPIAGITFLVTRPQITEYETAEITRGTLTVLVNATGQLQPTNQIQVGAEVSGLIREVLVDFNDEVSAGDLLALIDTEELSAIVVQANAALASAEASLAEANAIALESRAARNRTSALVRNNNASPQALDTRNAALASAEAGVSRAEAGVVQAQAALDSAQSRLGEAEIRSPINGMVLDRLIEEGQTVAASFQTPHLFTIAQDLSQMELQVDVDEADIGVVHEGQMASFTVDAYPAREFEAEIVQVRNAPRQQSGVVTYEALLVVANPDFSLKPGMTATADITVGVVEDALLVPNGALRFMPPDQEDAARPSSSDGTLRGQVWLETEGEGEQSIPEALELEIGESDGRLTVILDGMLEVGQEVIVDVVRNRRGN